MSSMAARTAIKLTGRSTSLIASQNYEYPIGSQSGPDKGRQPAFVGAGGSSVVSFGELTFFWGSVPAYDVLSLLTNEGVDYQGDLDMCFAG